MRYKIVFFFSFDKKKNKPEPLREREKVTFGEIMPFTKWMRNK